MDSFKGCLGSDEANKAAERGVLDVFPDAEVVKFPVSDGGEGLLNAFSHLFSLKKVTVRVHNPLMKLMDGYYYMTEDGATAFVELAVASGLPLLDESERNPLVTTTYGTGELIADALHHGCRNFVIGIGGSATNDAALGLLRALGFCFKDKDGNELNDCSGRVLKEVMRVDKEHVFPELEECKFEVACDVSNPFCGEDGAVRVFAPQKGADEMMIKQLEDGMQSFSNVVAETTGKDIARMPGAGAAGGVGGSLYAFLNAQLKPGIELMLDKLDFDNKIGEAILVITGEGSADRQTLMGKVPSGIMKRAMKQHIPTVLLAGIVNDLKTLQDAGFRQVICINPSGMSTAEMMRADTAKHNIRQVVGDLMNRLR